MEGMPSFSTIKAWLAQDSEFSAQYARAREGQADTLADELVEIADEEPDPQRARVRIDARKWYASKLQPKKYGDKLDMNVTATTDFAQRLIRARERVKALRQERENKRRGKP